ncbi:MAG: hypothetical protein Q8Q14_16550 [Gemmatimonadales bacterium]|nr:hypothetical protein [Gemmatimonadales bacterium]
MRSKAKQLNLTDAQKDQLKERDATEKAAAESALLKFYMEVWLPRAEGGSIGIEKIAVGGRPLQTTVDEKKRALIHLRVMELFTTVQPLVFGSVTQSRIADLFQLGTGDTPKTGVRVCDVVAGFFTFLGFPRLSSDGVVRQAILKGIETSQFGYITGTPKLGEDGRYQIDHSRVAIGRRLGDDEVDLETGFLISPSAIPAKPETKTTETKEGDGPTPPTGGGGGAGSGGGGWAVVRLEAARRVVPSPAAGAAMPERTRSSCPSGLIATRSSSHGACSQTSPTWRVRSA